MSDKGAEVICGKTARSARQAVEPTEFRSSRPRGHNGHPNSKMSRSCKAPPGDRATGPASAEVLEPLVWTGARAGTGIDRLSCLRTASAN